MAAATNLACGANQTLIRALVDGLLQNPEVDLVSLIPTSYKSDLKAHRNPATTKIKSKAAQLNRKTLLSVPASFETNPEADLLDSFPPGYKNLRRNRLIQIKSENEIDEQPTVEVVKPFHWSVTGRDLTSYTISFPLSLQLQELMEKASSLCCLIEISECIWQSGTGAFVSRLSNSSLIVKATYRSQENHYIALDYLTKHGKQSFIPAPHGLIQLKGISLLFTSFIAGSTLTNVWSTLSRENKTQIQNQLDSMFAEIRKLPQGNRHLGLLDGTGIIDDRGGVEVFKSAECRHIETVSEFEEVSFTSNDYLSKSYVGFLKKFLPPDRLHANAVLTHCDVRPDNIILQETARDKWVVGSIIDWEDAGFYPPYWEAVKSTRAFNVVIEDDWYLYQPKCIAPCSYTSQWLVDYLWDTLRQQLRGFGITNARLPSAQQPYPRS
jgi:hypothetical protein